MNRSYFLGVLASLMLGLTACSGSSSNINSSSNRANSGVMKSENAANTMSIGNSSLNANRPAADPGDFWKKAAEGGMAEVEFSKLAFNKAQNADVKKYAQMMITDHTKAGDELKSLAAKKGISLPENLDADHKVTLEKLKELTGADFDKAYVEAMVKDHDAAVELFKTQANSGTDSELKSFAAKTLPTLESHHKKIEEIQGKMK